jgi:uncharacterized protein YciI
MAAEGNSIMTARRGHRRRRRAYFCLSSPQPFWIEILTPQKGTKMFVISLNYVKPLAEIEEFLQAHREFLERYYASGHFLLSGRKEPRTGGVILATAESKEEIESIVLQDPFKREQAAEYEIVEFLPSMAQPYLTHLKRT